MIKMKLSKELLEELDAISTIVSFSSGNTYRYIPFWFRETGVDGEFEPILLGKLPLELTDFILEEKDGD